MVKNQMKSILIEGIKNFSNTPTDNKIASMIIKGKKINNKTDQQSATVHICHMFQYMHPIFK